MDEKGEEHNSLSFYKKIDDLINQGKDIVFIIGSSNGTSKDLKKNIKEKISLSKLTFTSDQARLILTEQIYRSMMIKNSKRYHK